MSKQIPAGVWPAMLTCLDDDGRPSQANIEKLVELFVQQKVGGLFVLGSTGSGPALDVATRKEVAKITIKAVAGRLPVMLHVGTVAPKHAIELAKHGQDVGADAISTVPAIYYPMDANIMFAYYKAVAGATNLPFFPYHFAVSALPPVQEYVRRLLELPNIQGMKVTDINLYTLQMIRAYSQDKLTLYSGADELVIPAAAAGAHGAIGSTYNFWHPAVSKARQAFMNGQFEQGQQFMMALGRVISRLLADYGSFYPFMRKVMKLKYDVEIGPSQASMGMVTGNMDDKTAMELFEEVNQAAGL